MTDPLHTQEEHTKVNQAWYEMLGVSSLAYSRLFFCPFVLGCHKSAVD